MIKLLLILINNMESKTDIANTETTDHAQNNTMNCVLCGITFKESEF